MGLFSRFKKQKQLSESELKWNAMWELRGEGKIESPFEELMSYYSEVLNGGHAQYFSNLSDNDELELTVDILFAGLPTVLKENFTLALSIYKRTEENGEESEADAQALYKCDEFYEENENLLEEILQNYAMSL